MYIEKAIVILIITVYIVVEFTHILEFLFNTFHYKPNRYVFIHSYEISFETLVSTLSPAISTDLSLWKSYFSNKLHKSNNF